MWPPLLYLLFLAKSHKTLKVEFLSSRTKQGGCVATFQEWSLTPMPNFRPGWWIDQTLSFCSHHIISLSREFASHHQSPCRNRLNALYVLQTSLEILSVWLHFQDTDMGFTGLHSFFGTHRFFSNDSFLPLLCEHQVTCGIHLCAFWPRKAWRKCVS